MHNTKQEILCYRNVPIHSMLAQSMKCIGANLRTAVSIICIEEITKKSLFPKENKPIIIQKLRKKSVVRSIYGNI